MFTLLHVCVCVYVGIFLTGAVGGRAVMLGVCVCVFETAQLFYQENKFPFLISVFVHIAALFPAPLSWPWRPTSGRGFTTLSPGAPSLSISSSPCFMGASSGMAGPPPHIVHIHTVTTSMIIRSPQELHCLVHDCISQ